MAAAAAQYYFRFRTCWYRCFQKVKVYKQTKFRRHISIDGRDITTSVFEKTNVRHIGNLLSVSIFDHLPKICTLFCIGLPNFVRIEAPIVEIWRHIHFSKWRPRRLNTASGFVSVDVTAFRKSKSVSKPNFVEISQMEADIYFLWQSKMAWEGVKFFSKSRMCQYPGMLCYILWIQKCIFDACWV